MAYANSSTVIAEGAVQASRNALSELLLPLKTSRTSPALIQRYWADFGIGHAEDFMLGPEVFALLEQPQELAPLMSKLRKDVVWFRVMLPFVASLQREGSNETRSSQEPAEGLLYRGFNYLRLLNALTTELERHKDGFCTLLDGRISEIIFNEIPYENFFEEAKSKGVYWGAHLFTESEGAVVCAQSAARLLHANILMAVVSEALGPRGAETGYMNASCGYLLAERVAEHGLGAISFDWRAIYRSWNAAFVSASSSNTDAAQITASALLLPALTEARSAIEWLRRRAISLLFVVLSAFHPDSTLNVGTEVADSSPIKGSSLRRWGRANREAMHVAGLAGSRDRTAGLGQITRITRQARAMNRFMTKLRSCDLESGEKMARKQAVAMDLAATWARISRL
jgi:hypothetical protein